MLPTNVRLPTLLDALRDRYVRGSIDLAEFERDVGALLDAGREDEAAPWGGVAPLATEGVER